METAQIEQELEDLEARMERLRALYEQYFLGLEKLEPMVLRKEVDRKLWVLRRAQIRNTGMRFKFQMLVQRYNTYQQYWTRVVREIENGTYRRDIIKVAQRFGEKEAMTILGKRRAAQYKRLAEVQLERRKRLRELTGEADENGAGATEAPSIEVEAAPVSLDDDDIELVEDERDEGERDEEAVPTPPRAVPPVRERVEPDMESLLMFATVGVTTWGAPARPAPTKPDPAKPDPAIDAPPASPAVPDVPAVAAPAGAPAAPAAAAVPAARAPVSSPRTSAPAVSRGKSRVAELAAQMRAKKQEAAKPRDELALDDLFEAKPAAPKPAPAAPAAPEQRPAPPEQRPAAAASPQPKPVPAATASSQPKPVPAATASPQPKPAPAAAASPQPKPAPAAGTRPEATRPAAARTGDLDEQKIREIYARYVGAKRAANESTAGITFDKLAASLRAQADKLKTSHPSRTVDFEVVMKDGKTALRPILK